jgi:hypothetical protein
MYKQENNYIISPFCKTLHAWSPFLTDIANACFIVEINLCLIIICIWTIQDKPKTFCKPMQICYLEDFNLYRQCYFS